MNYVTFLKNLVILYWPVSFSLFLLILYFSILAFKTWVIFSLSPYLEEMPVTVPSDDDPEVTLNQLKSYYESLNSLLEKYKDDSPNTKA